MKLAAFDIGIKNLAYCILEKKSADDIKVLEWDIINLIDTGKCCKENCPLSASYQVGGDSNPRFLCVLHKDEIDDTMKGEFLSEFVACSKQCSSCTKTENVFESETDGVLCARHRDMCINKKLKPKKMKGKKCAEIPVEQLKVNIVKALDARKSLIQVDEVVIENQPSLKNPRMKAVSDTLYTWYVIRGKVDSNHIKKISFVSPAGKLKGFDTKALKTSTNKYKTTKDLAIKYATETLNKDKDNAMWVCLLEKHKKQDDMADAFLHGWQALTKAK